jgi:hypothetical protein
MFTSAFPETFSSVVMIDGCGPWVSLEDGTTAQTLFRCSVNDWMKRDSHVASPRLHDSIEELIDARQKNRFSPAGISRHAAAALVRRGVKRVADGKLQYSHDPRAAVAELQGNTEEQAVQFLAKLPRALCLMADNGIEGGPKAFLERRRSAFPDLTLRTMEGGHHLHLDTPEPVAALIADFLMPVMPRALIPAATGRTTKHQHHTLSRL